VADLARREARREPVAAARRAAEAVVADEKWRAAQEKRERAARTSKGLGAQRQRVWKSKSDEHIARSEQLRRAQSGGMVKSAPPPPPPPPSSARARLPH